MPSYRDLDDIDKAFIEDVYSSPEWSVRKMARKLDCTEDQVKNYAKRVGLERPPRQAYFITSRSDWEAIWHLCQIEGRSFSEAGRIAGCSYQSVSYAISQMRRMTPEQREIKWSLYRDLHGDDDVEESKTA